MAATTQTFEIEAETAAKYIIELVKRIEKYEPPPHGEADVVSRARTFAQCVFADLVTKKNTDPLTGKTTAPAPAK